MKYILPLILFACVVMTACSDTNNAGAARTEQPAAAPSDQENGLKKELIHHNFVLSKVNGADFSNERLTPSIAFNEGFHISGAVCNRYAGQGELKGNILTVKQMISTKMFCAEQELNKLEQEFSLLLRQGATLKLVGKTLTLSNQELHLEFTLRDLVQ